MYATAPRSPAEEAQGVVDVFKKSTLYQLLQSGSGDKEQCLREFGIFYQFNDAGTSVKFNFPKPDGTEADVVLTIPLNVEQIKTVLKAAGWRDPCLD